MKEYTKDSRLNSKKLIGRLLEDDNTTNSEASEMTVFGDINWEENIEVDTTNLIDEFAPRPTKSPKDFQEKFVDKSVRSPSPKQMLEDVEGPDDYKINLNISVQNYNTTQWQKGKVVEIDWDEEEILIHYEEPGLPDEWLSMKSQRLKKNKSESPSSLQKEIMEPISPVNQTILQLVDEKSYSEVECLSDEPTEQVSKLSLTYRKMKRVKRKFTVKKSIRKSNKTSENTVKTMKRSQSQPVLYKPKSKTNRPNLSQKSNINRRMPIWKSSEKKDGTCKQSKASKSRFQQDEKVLAKWSDHRMQKFPAVIKQVIGSGSYDVLFYDGFEKTLTEENIFKTTEAEMAKYNKCKPSEADNFVEIDDTSKEERRMKKKKKVSDDFFSDEHFKRKKRRSLFDLSTSESFENASTARKSSVIKDSLKGTTENSSEFPSFSVHSRKILKKVDDIETTIEDIQTTESNLVVDKINTFDHNEILRKTESLDESKLTMEKPCVENILQPMEIKCHDGILRRTVVINDEKLPVGWSKHVISWFDDSSWSCFLFSPDGYGLHSFIELRKYYEEVYKTDIPPDLNFSFPKEVIKRIAEEQRTLSCNGVYKKWLKRSQEGEKTNRKVNILPAVSHSDQPPKKLKTLLPKVRSLPKTLPDTSSIAEGQVWRCPKDDCDKKFRKENLLQMHIKHYHSDLKALATSAPNMVDLARARNYESWSTDKHSKKSHNSRSFIEKQILHTPDSSISTSLSLPSSKIDPEDEKRNKELTPKLPPEEKRSTIKTLLPTRVHKVPLNKIDMEVTPEREQKTDVTTNETVKPVTASKLKKEPKIPDDITKDNGVLPLVVSRAYKRKQQLPCIEKVQIASDSNDSVLEEHKNSPELTEDGIVIERLKSEEIINCTCGFREEDGLMIQCEICLCWQHGLCHGYNTDKDVPEKYVCKICRSPEKVRSSQKYSYARHYLTQAKLPRFSSRTYKEDLLNKREKMLSRSFELTASLQHLQRIERSLCAKLSIAEQADHPKLYLWSTDWVNPKRCTGTDLDFPSTLSCKKDISSEMTDDKTTLGSDADGDDNLAEDLEVSAGVKSEKKPNCIPIPEALIESDDCRIKLLDHIEHYQQQMESRLSFIQAQIAAIESDDIDFASEETASTDHHPLLIQVVYMLLRDLNTISTAAALS